MHIIGCALFEGADTATHVLRLRHLFPVFSVFQGGDNTATAADWDAKTPKEDKTGLIQLELGKNRDGAIETIRYNSSLAFDETMDYGNRDINESKRLTDNKWYTGGGNKEYYYDRGLVGTIIAHVSKAAVENKEEGILKTLDIGEFRKGEKGFYVYSDRKSVV